MKYWIGPMSKNVVDAVIEFNGDFGFIPFFPTAQGPEF